MTPADLEALALQHGGTVTRVNAAALAAPLAVRGGKVSERDFQQAVIDFARSRGWKVAHFRPARVLRRGKETYETPVAADGKGFPDLLMVRGTRVVVAELKSATGVLGEAQASWIRAFDSTLVEWFVWKPADAAEVERTLT